MNSPGELVLDITSRCGFAILVSALDGSMTEACAFGEGSLSCLSISRCRERRRISCIRKLRCRSTLLRIGSLRIFSILAPFARGGSLAPRAASVSDRTLALRRGEMRYG